MPEQLATTSESSVSSRAPLAVEAPAAGSLAFLRHLDLIALAVAVPVSLALGAPAVGVVVSASAWVTQHLVARAARRWIDRRGPGAPLGLSLVDAFGRIWLLAGAIVLAAVIGGRSDGLTAALMIFGAYSAAFAVRLVSGRPQGEPRQ
jgi:hypothetical protein